MSELNVYEIFKSIQGESSYTGVICSFVRLSKCNLNCLWCDTKYALEEGTARSLDQIVNEVKRHNTSVVEVTGGEPLIQEDTPILCRRFLDLNYTVLVETNGSRDISVLPEGCRRIVDVKCPSSGMAGSFLESNCRFLTPSDELKYVISNRSDFDWALSHLSERNLQTISKIIFSPNTSMLPAAELASMILETNAPVRLGIQLHKVLWGKKRGV
ncbi:MAG: radical SAM protein [Fibrobacter sp.]|mgnify:CR=1 FL=1|nr:radical SAM protein [Fibrobacter sp.]